MARHVAGDERDLGAAEPPRRHAIEQIGALVEIEGPPFAANDGVVIGGKSQPPASGIEDVNVNPEAAVPAEAFIGGGEACPMESLVGARQEGRGLRLRQRRRRHQQQREQGRACHTASIASTLCSSTLAPFAQSAQRVSSFGEWLMPATLGTKIMPIGPSCAIICAS